MKNIELRVLARRAALAATAALILAAWTLPSRATGLLNDGDLRTDIAAVPPSVTQSTAALTTYASYTVTVTKQDSSAGQHGQLRFQGSASVAGLPTGSTQMATLFSASGASCGPAGASTIDCSIPGTLTATGQTVSFSVTFKTPTAGTSITLSGQTQSVELSAGGTFNEVTDTVTATTALTAPDPDRVSTFVPASPTATTLYSGTNTANGVVGAIPIVDANAGRPINDPFTTTVIIPAGSSATTVSVIESEVLASCSANPRCFQSKLTVPGAFNFLTIILRRDRTTLISSSPPKGHRHHDDKKHGDGHDKDDDDDDDDGRHSGQSSIDNAIVKYFPDNDPANPEHFIIVPDCAVVPGGLPTPKNPCIASRKAYPKKGSHKTPVPAGLEGDWEFVIHALDNGRYVN